MGRLLLIRHGESEGNVARVFTRTPAVPITENGRAQVERAAEWVVARYRPSRIVTSPFVRARQTADILAARLGLPVSVEDDLRERSYGELAGQPYASARALPDFDPARYWLWRPPGGGENLLEVATRAGAVLDRVARAAPDDEVLVVSHGAVMMGLWFHVTGAWRAGRVSRNAGLIVVEHRGDAYLGATAIEEDL
jgi:probable phosphoglycerate mutase